VRHRHSHAAGGERHAPRFSGGVAYLCNPEDALLYLTNGVTTVRNMDGRPVHLLWRKRIASGQMLGPTIYTASPAIHTAKNAEEGRRLVRTYLFRNRVHRHARRSDPDCSQSPGRGRQCQKAAGSDGARALVLGSAAARDAGRASGALSGGQRTPMIVWRKLTGETGRQSTRSRITERRWTSTLASPTRRRCWKSWALGSSS